ncbi:hypothetical protein D3C75_449000 [compost metagenome]
MNKWKLATIITVIVIVAGGGIGYYAYDYYAGNHVEVKDVIGASSSSGGTQAAAAATSAAPADVNGTWNIQSASEVYFSVTTSKETVNFSVKPVTGSWTLNTADAAQNKAEGSVDLSGLSSGNGQRDNHIKGSDYLQVDQHPKATFAVKSFENLPKEWKAGVTESFKMTGTLTVRGISKDVTFDAKAQLDGSQLKLEGQTVVTFEDYGMKNPHTVVLSAQNDVTVQLRLVLAK